MITTRTPWLRLPALAAVALLALFTLIAAGCGGDDKASSRTAAASPTAVVRGGGEQLVASREFLQDSAERSRQASTLRGKFSATMSIGDGIDLSYSGTLAVRSPGDMYMKMDMMGQPFEMLMLLPDVYVRWPGEDDWQIVSAEAAGLNREAYEKYLQNQGLVGYGDVTEQLQGLEQLPDEGIDGVQYMHVRGTLDYAALAADLPADLASPEVMEGLKNFPPVRTELWIDRESRLPRRMVIDMEYNIPDSQGLKMHMVMDYLEYNGPVDIPERPENPKPFELPQPN